MIERERSTATEKWAISKSMTAFFTLVDKTVPTHPCGRSSALRQSFTCYLSQNYAALFQTILSPPPLPLARKLIDKCTTISLTDTPSSRNDCFGAVIHFEARHCPRRQQEWIVVSLTVPLSKRSSVNATTNNSKAVDPICTYIERMVVQARGE